MKDGSNFDGKDLYFEHTSNLVSETFDSPKTPIVVTFGIADSNNDLESITSSKTKGFTIVPSNAVSIKADGSKLQNRLENLSKAETKELKLTLKANGVSTDKANILAQNIKVVKENPNRFIFFPTGPNSEINLGINDGYQILNSLINMAMFSRETNETK